MRSSFNFLADVFGCCFKISVLSSRCHLFWQVHQSCIDFKTPPQYESSTPALHYWNGLQTSPFFSFKCNNLPLCFHLPTVIRIFYVAFGVMSFSSLSGLSVNVGPGLVLLWITTLSYQLQQHFQKVFSCWSGVDKHTSHQSTSISGTQKCLVP